MRQSITDVTYTVMYAQQVFQFTTENIIQIM